MRHCSSFFCAFFAPLYIFVFWPKCRAFWGGRGSGIFTNNAAADDVNANADDPDRPRGLEALAPSDALPH